MDNLADRAAISDTVLAYATGVDRRDWNLYSSIFTDPFESDFSSWSGRAPGSMSVNLWVEAVRSGLSGFDATHHTSSNHVHTFHSDDEATCVSYMTAQHVIDGNWCTLGGYYTNTLVRTDERWKICRCQLTVTWSTGDRSVFDVARRRWQATQGRQAGQ